MSEPSTHLSPPARRSSFALRCAVVYLVAGYLWIGFSDRIAQQLGADFELHVQTFKGWAYVAASALVLYLAVRRFERRVTGAEQEARAARAQLEELVRQRTAELATATGEVRQTTRDIEALADSIARDLRAPLRAITGFVDIVRRRYAQPIPVGATLDGSDAPEDPGHSQEPSALPELARYLEYITAAVDQMTGLVDELLQYSKLSGAVVRRHPVRLDDVVEHALAALAGRAHETGARVTVDGPLPDVIGEKTLLRQIVLALLDNAIKFTRPGESPEVEVSADAQGAEGAVVLRVRDHGIGVAPEHRATLFRPFRRLHTPDEYPGAGMGLASVKRAAGMLGGAAGVESAEGAGAVFWVRLPAVRAER